MAAFDSHVCMTFKIKTQFDILCVVYKQPVIHRYSSSKNFHSNISNRSKKFFQTGVTKGFKTTHKIYYTFDSKQVLSKWRLYISPALKVTVTAA